MPWPSIIVAVVAALATAATSGWALRRLPRAGEAPDYAALATPRFALAVGILALAATLASAALTPPAHWLAWASLGTVNVLAIGIDARTTWLPLPLARVGWAVAALGVGVAAALRRDPWVLVWSAAGALVVGGFFHLVWLVTRQVGYGDVRLAATLGAVAALEGLTVSIWSVVLGTAAGAGLGIVHAVRGGRGAFAYGPGLWVGPYLALGLTTALTAL
ncbi:MAG: hypothetical protein L0G22_08965 [Propionibacteriaceae bacterium]|nr:hypothetical protein [Propionibacteriaceae bacterium]